VLRDVAVGLEQVDSQADDQSGLPVVNSPKFRTALEAPKLHGRHSPARKEGVFPFRYRQVNRLQSLFLLPHVVSEAIVSGRESDKLPS
jgi:hypothetical protein